MRITILLAAILVVGCATTYPVLKTGENTFQVSANASPARGGIAGAQQMAVSSANKKCDSMGKAITVINIETGHEFPAAGRAIVTFKCT
jgi:hypothetical protein